MVWPDSNTAAYSIVTCMLAFTLISKCSFSAAHYFSAHAASVELLTGAVFLLKQHVFEYYLVQSIVRATM